VLQMKPLDDTRYDDILESAMNRLPALCPTWTDYNAHDPGVTLIELFSWYEEMQRYHLDRMTPQIRRRLLALLNAEPKHSAPARCLVDLSGHTGVWPEGTTFHTDEDIVFELAETVQIAKTQLSGVVVTDGKREIDVTNLIGLDETVIQPFLYGGEKTSLVLKFRGVEESILRLWICVSEPEECPRNPFGNDDQMPRTITWYWNGKEIVPEQDETHAMSITGFVTLPVTPCEEGELHLVLTDPGCEEVVRIQAIKVGMCPAIQQQTHRKLFSETVAAGAATKVELCYTPAVEGQIIAFLRGEHGWEQIMSTGDERTDLGRRLTFDTSHAVQDGEANLMLVCISMYYLQDTFLSSDGLPDQEITLPLEGRYPVGDMQLICDSLDLDGEIRPMLWHRVYDLNMCGPRDRVFSYDAVRESLVFGDGLHGAIVPAGDNAILIASLRISERSLGNIPGGDVLYLPDGGELFTCTPAVGGAETETLQAAANRFLNEMANTHKCATADDYARIAMHTPGLRVARAKALPGVNMDDPTGQTVGSVVSVIVIPYSQSKCPVPDQRFLQAVKEELEKYRPICTAVDVRPPRYFKISVQIRIWGDRTVAEETIRERMNEWLGEHDIGAVLSHNSLSLYLQKQPGVWKIDRLELGAASGGCRKSGTGDIILPLDGIAYLDKLELEIKSQYHYT